MEDTERDMADDEIRPDPDCDDCGGFRIKKYDAHIGKWTCPRCEEGEEVEVEDE